MPDFDYSFSFPAFLSECSLSIIVLSPYDFLQLMEAGAVAACLLPQISY